MKIIIVGCSRVGETLATQLRAEGNDITIIDLNPEKINALTAKLDIMGIVGNGATNSTLKEAGIDSTDLLIAVTDSDELNLLCCMIAKKNDKCRVIARVTNPEYSTEASYLKDELGLEMIINPELESAGEIARVLRFPSALKVETFAKGKVELITFRLPEECPLIGMAAREISTKLKCGVLVCAVERSGDAYIPNGDFVFEEGDVISVVVSSKKISDFFEKIDLKVSSAKDATIVGAGRLTHYLCDMLEGSGIAVKVIDKDLEACEELSTKFDWVTVINGDGTDHELLTEEGIARTDAFLALAKHDEENILLSLFVKNEHAAKVITKINRPENYDIVKHLCLDTTIYPKSVTADIIVRYVRATKNTLGSNIEAMYSIVKDTVEASEFIVGNDSPVTNVPLSQLEFKKDILVAAIIRKRTVIIPRGVDVMLPGDSVVIVSKKTALHDIADVLVDTLTAADELPAPTKNKRTAKVNKK